MKLVSTLILGLILMINVLADSKRAITFEDFFALKRLSNLKISSTGNYLSVEVTTPDIKENTLDKSILIMKTNGDIIQEFGSKKEKVKKPYINNSEEYVYFIKEKQIWRMKIDGSMPKKLTDIPSGVKNYKFSPKENYILIESDILPAGKTNDYLNSEGEKGSKIQACPYNR